MKAIFEVYNPLHRRWVVVDDMEHYHVMTRVLGYRGRCNKGEAEQDDLQLVTNSPYRLLHDGVRLPA
jgi:hypothetical protein